MTKLTMSTTGPFNLFNNGVLEQVRVTTSRGFHDKQDFADILLNPVSIILYSHDRHRGINEIKGVRFAKNKKKILQISNKSLQFVYKSKDQHLKIYSGYYPRFKPPGSQQTSRQTVKTSKISIVKSLNKYLTFLCISDQKKGVLFDPIYDEMYVTNNKC